MSPSSDSDSVTSVYFESFWNRTLAGRLWLKLSKWRALFASEDDARLTQRNIDHECLRSDIDVDIWTEFLTEILTSELGQDPHAAIDRILTGPNRSRYLLPGKPITWAGDLCHYEPLERFAEYCLGTPIGDDRQIEAIASAIEGLLIDGVDIEGRVLGRLDRPYWVTDDELREQTESDVVRDRLGLRSVNRAGHKLVEIRYRYTFLQGKRVPLKAPTVLDAWQGGSRSSWIFRKRGKFSDQPDCGCTVDSSLGAGGSPGGKEAVHAALPVQVGDGSNLNLRILKATTGTPPELSLPALLKNEAF